MQFIIKYNYSAVSGPLGLRLGGFLLPAGGPALSLVIWLTAGAVDSGATSNAFSPCFNPDFGGGVGLDLPFLSSFLSFLSFLSSGGFGLESLVGVAGLLAGFAAGVGFACFATGVGSGLVDNGSAEPGTGSGFGLFLSPEVGVSCENGALVSLFFSFSWVAWASLFFSFFFWF